MYMTDARQLEEYCKNEVVEELKKYGIKFKIKKPKQTKHISEVKVFNVHLAELPKETVILKKSRQVQVPKIVHYLCTLILRDVRTEGIFRRESSKVREGKIKTILNGGGRLDEVEKDAIDLACVLKDFFRQLPEPLIPSNYHSCFMQAAALNEPEKTKAILLICLLLPLEHLETVMYLMEFLAEVAKYYRSNRMDAKNLAVCIGPSIMPSEKLTANNVQTLMSQVNEVITILIENSLNVGYIPKNVMERVDSDTVTNRNQKRSVSRVFNGLKKMVSGRTEENHNVIRPDLLLTPVNNVIIKKRRGQTNGLSNKKRKELLNKLPDNVLLSTPFTPCRTPISMDLSGSHEKHLKDSTDLMKVKKSHWFSRSKSVKNLKNEENITKKNVKSGLERRWSAITQPNNVKKTKKRNSFAAPENRKENVNLNKCKENSPEPDYIRVPKEEYEAIKNKVSAMERRISMELDTVQSLIKSESESETKTEVDNNVQNVQTVYEQTLVQAEQLSPTTDRLARRLSRELNIRRSDEHKIIRSPSARKIGSMRRRSKEFEKNNSKVTRHQSWHVPPAEPIPRVNLKRGKPNTVQTGLPANRLVNEVLEPRQIKRSRSSSVGDNTAKSISCNMSGSSNDKWVSAEGFFATLKSSDESSSLSNRASLARLRSQNAGMVLAKARLFDQLKDSSDSSSSLVRSIPRPKVGNKIGSVRNVDSRLSYRVRNLKYEDKRLNKKNVSPRRRNTALTRQKLQMAKQYLDSSGEKNSDKENIPGNLTNLQRKMPLKDCTKNGSATVSSPKYLTPRAVPPHIKTSLNVRSPKRLCRTPIGTDRSTPLRILKTPINNI